MAEIFTWERKPGSEGKITFRVRKAQFGDGYTQTVQDGLNNAVQNWPMAFEGDLTYLQPIIDFINRQAGATSFLWTPPGSSVQCLWRVESYNLTSIGAGVYSLTTEFIQSFVP